MVKLSVKEFAEEWRKAPNHTAIRFWLAEAEIQEWIKHGKFSKIKEYCYQLPYEVKMMCLEPEPDRKCQINTVKGFGFIFKTVEDAGRLYTLIGTLKELRSCIEVETASFQELNPCPEEERYGIANAMFIPAQCPLVI